MNIIQAIILAVVQGISELFPISSVAHAIIVPYLLRWNLDPTFLKTNFLEFVVMMHVGTTLSLLVYFRKDWLNIFQSIFVRNHTKKVLNLIVLGTIPAFFFGAIFEKLITQSFSDTTSAALFLIMNGFLLWCGGRFQQSSTMNHGKKITELKGWQALVIGSFQSLALIPGFSRSGSSIIAGFFMGLSNEESAKFSMLLSTPMVAGAAVLEVPKLVQVHSTQLLKISLLSGAVAGVFSLLSVFILMKLFKRNEVNAMRPFSWYCIIIGALILIFKFRNFIEYLI